MAPQSRYPPKSDRYKKKDKAKAKSLAASGDGPTVSDRQLQSFVQRVHRLNNITSSLLHLNRTGLGFGQSTAVLVICYRRADRLSLLLNQLLQQVSPDTSIVVSQDVVFSTRANSKFDPFPLRLVL